MGRFILPAVLLFMILMLPEAAVAAEIDTGDTAWMLTSTALVLFMTLPGLALFYSGLVQSRNVLSVLMQCFAIACMVSIVWLICGYSLFATNGGGAQAFIGGLEKSFLAGVGTDSVEGTIPETVFIMFQMTFAIITPALIVGGFAERMRFSSMFLFTTLWLLLVYIPIAHWVWGGGWLNLILWILPVVLSCILMPVLRRWLQRWLWEIAKVFRKPRCRRIICQ